MAIFAGLFLGVGAFLFIFGVGMLGFITWHGIKLLWRLFRWVFSKRDGTINIEPQMEDLVWNHKLFTVTESDDGSSRTISLSELLEMDDVDKPTKREAVNQFLTMVEEQMSRDQVDQVLAIIRKRIPLLTSDCRRLPRLSSYPA